MTIRKFSLLTLVLVAFAANSILCRLALHSDPGLIDPASFTAIRLLSGTLMLFMILALTRQSTIRPNLAHSLGAFYLFIYAAAFSFAYISLTTGVGALILFGSVQISIILLSLIKGNHLMALEWLGSIFALVGLVILTGTDFSFIQTKQVSLMIVAGIAWSLFTLNGMDSKKPITDMSLCFLLSTPLTLAMLLGVFYLGTINVTTLGFVYATLSGAIASAVGYALWYWLLPNLSASQAGTSQLLVPIIAAIGGVVLLNESLTLNFAIAAITTLGGVTLVIIANRNRL